MPKERTLLDKINDKNEITRLNQELDHVYGQKKTLECKMTEIEIEKSQAITMYEISREMNGVYNTLVKTDQNIQENYRKQIRDYNYFIIGLFIFLGVLTYRIWTLI